MAPLDKALTDFMNQAGASAAADPVKLLQLEERHVKIERAILEAALGHHLALIELQYVVGSAPWRN